MEPQLDMFADAPATDGPPQRPIVREDGSIHEGKPCGNCADVAERQALFATLNLDYMRAILRQSLPFDEAMDVTGCSVERVAWERYHHDLSLWVVRTEVARREAGGKQEKPARTGKQERADRRECLGHCGRQVHRGGSGFCTPCSRGINKAAEQRRREYEQEVASELE